MKKVIILLLFFIATSFSTLGEQVYICNSRSASKYHYSETCRGLNACKHEIIKISLKEAKERGYGLCGWED